MPVGDFLVARVVQSLVFLMLGQIELYTVGVHSPADGLTELLPTDVDITGLHHLVSTEAVEMSEGDFAYQLVERFLRLEPTGLYVREVIENVLAGPLLLFGQVRHRGIRISGDLILLGEDGVLPLQHLTDVVFEQLAALRHDTAELVANLLVHVTRLPALAMPWPVIVSFVLGSGHLSR